MNSSPIRLSLTATKEIRELVLLQVLVNSLDFQVKLTSLPLVSQIQEEINRIRQHETVCNKMNN